MTAYERVLAQWGVPIEVWELASPYGRTGLISCGPTGAPPVVLLPGGGATGAVWFANAAALAQRHRVHAVDLPGDTGRTVPGEVAVDGVGALHGWLDTVVDAVVDTVGEPVDLVGHSYGAWIALGYALERAGRLGRLALLDPTRCFAGFAPRYLAHALPSLLRPSARRTTRLLRWEAGGLPLDPAWLELAARGAEQPTGRLVVGRRPAADRLRGLDLPTLVLLAGRSRAHDVARVRRRATELLPKATVTVLPDASHHTLPAHPAAAVNEALTDFLD